MTKSAISVLLALTLTACGGNPFQQRTSVYEGYTPSGPISNFGVAEIQMRQLDVVNAIRMENGLQPVAMSSALTAAAFTHARDMAMQQRSWNFGSDKSTPQDRAARAGFRGTITGENVSETYQGELSIVQGWLSEPISRDVILNKQATHVGIGFFLEDTGKVWWVQDFGAYNRFQ